MLPPERNVHPAKDSVRPRAGDCTHIYLSLPLLSVSLDIFYACTCVLSAGLHTVNVVSVGFCTYSSPPRAFRATRIIRDIFYHTLSRPLSVEVSCQNQGGLIIPGGEKGPLGVAIDKRLYVILKPLSLTFLFANISSNRKRIVV